MIVMRPKAAAAEQQQQQQQQKNYAYVTQKPTGAGVGSPASSVHIPTMTSSPTVLVRTQELPSSDHQVVIISLNRPDKKNCFNLELVHALSAAFRDVNRKVQEQQLAHDDGEGQIAAVILTGEGSSFCAGADLSNPPSPIDQSSDLPHHLHNNPVHQMSLCAVPIIGALKGYVITGGFELALACDILVGDESTVFRDTHVKFGLAPCWALSQKLQRRIGTGRAKLISLSACKVKASQAYEFGLLDALVPAGTTSQNKALDIADQIAGNNVSMVQRYKRAIVEGGSMDLAKGMQRERELGMAHYIEAVGDGSTFEGAKEFITDESRPRSKL